MPAAGPQQLAVRGPIVKHCQDIGAQVPACVGPLGVPQEAKPVAAEPMIYSVIVELDGHRMAGSLGQGRWPRRVPARGDAWSSRPKRDATLPRLDPADAVA